MQPLWLQVMWQTCSAAERALACAVQQPTHVGARDAALRLRLDATQVAPLEDFTGLNSESARWQVSGADESSLYVEVTDIAGDDVVCEAKNSAVLAGLLTLVHSRAGASTPVDMPLLAQADRAAFKCGPPAWRRVPVDWLSARQRVWSCK